MKRWKAGFLLLIFSAMAVMAQHTSALGETKPIELFYSNVFPGPHKLCISAVEWGKEVETRTNGRVKITMFPGGTLTPGDKCYDGVVNGISHLGMSVLSYTAGKFPLMEAVDLPLGYKSGLADTKIANDVYAKFKPKELSDVKVMYLMAPGPSLIHTKKPVNKLDDLKGMKIRGTGTTARIMQALGATPVAMPMPDTYDALSKGVVEGVTCPIECLEGWRLGEVTDFSVKTDTANSICMFVVMNKGIWESLPKDVQEIIDKLNEEWIPKTGALWDEIDQSGYEFAKKRGHEVITPPAGEQIRWTAAVQPMLDDYVKSMKQKGLPGDEALAFIQERIKALQ